MTRVEVNIDLILEELNLTKNRLAVEAKLRPNLMTEITTGEIKSIRFVTLIKLLDAINKISEEQGGRFYNVADILHYTKQ